MNKNMALKRLLKISILICAFSEGIRQIVGVPVVHAGNAIILVVFCLLLAKGNARGLKMPEANIILLGGAAFLLSYLQNVILL